MTTITDENREEITEVYCSQLLDSMTFATLYNFANSMLKDGKSGLTNEMLTNQILDYCPDILKK